MMDHSPAAIPSELQTSSQEDLEVGTADSQSDEDLLALAPSTLTALTSFFDEQEAARKSLLSLYFQSHSETSTKIERDVPRNISPRLNPRHEDTFNPQNITIKAFQEAFKEDWQLSQFWYSRDTAERLASALKSVCAAGDRVAFLCCPTGYVAFKENRTATELYLFEHDMRLSILAGADFIHYDLDMPLSFADVEALQGLMDIVVVDPPFHSEESQRKVSSTIKHIIRPGGRLVLLTGLTLSPLIDAIYPSPPLPRLRRRDFAIEHDGVGRLMTPYGCWVGCGENVQNDEVFGNTLDECTL